MHGCIRVRDICRHQAASQSFVLAEIERLKVPCVRAHGDVWIKPIGARLVLIAIAAERHRQRQRRAAREDFVGQASTVQRAA